MRWHIVGIVLFVSVFLIYHVTFSSVPTGDWYTWVSGIEQADYDILIISSHPLPLYFLFLLKRGLSSLGVRTPTLLLLQTVNAVLAAIGAVLFYRVVTLLGGSALLATLGGALLALSFGYWYFANGEILHYGLVVVLAIFLLVLRRRLSGVPYGYGYVCGLALLNSFAVMLHQEHFVFGFTVLALLSVGRPWQRAMKEGTAYTLVGSIGTVLMVFAIGVFLRGMSPTKIVRWYIWLATEGFAAGLEPYEVGGFPSLVAREIKAQLTAIVFGTQVMVDIARWPTLLEHREAVRLSALTIVAYGLLTFLLVEGWRRRRLIRDRFLIPFTGCAVWLVSYKVLIHSWFQTPSTLYHVATVPPVILLLLLGPIAGQADTRASPRQRGLGVGSIAAFVAVLFVINFWGGILPWFRYGQMKNALAMWCQTEVRSRDLFISSESGLDSVLHACGDHLDVKDVFRRMPKVEVFRLVERAVAERLGQGGRVFMYNFVPSPFTLRGINLSAAHRGSEPVTRGDFEEFLGGLQKRYAFVAVLSYWEESKEPLYLYGKRVETLREVRGKARRAEEPKFLP